MSARSIVLERFTAWLEAEDSDFGLKSFRRVFACIWLLYDVVDVSLGATERARSWFPHERGADLMALQVALIVSGIMLALGRRVWVFGMLAAAARTIEALAWFPLNDFLFGSIVYLLLAHSEGGPFARNRRPTWVRDLLRMQFAWVYLTTAFLKINPAWLDGGHVFVRTQYLARALHWPFPAALARALGSIPVDAALSRAGVGLELLLGVVLVAGGPYWLGVGLSVAVHAFGALMMNVWFFSATMVAGVALILPRRLRPSVDWPELRREAEGGAHHRAS
jgi:hypothetical protein